MSSKNSAIFDTVYPRDADNLVNMHKEINGITMRFYNNNPICADFPCVASDPTEHALSSGLLVFAISVITNKISTQIYIGIFTRNNLGLLGVFSTKKFRKY